MSGTVGVESKAVKKGERSEGKSRGIGMSAGVVVQMSVERVFLIAEFLFVEL